MLPRRSWVDTLSQQEQLNFLLTNRIPRHLVTRFFAWFSRLQHPLVRRPSMKLWEMFAERPEAA
jgi:phosphatidylserine decarboxylase